MLTTRIAAGVVAAVLGVSGVAVNGNLTTEADTETKVETPATQVDIAAEADAAARTTTVESLNAEAESNAAVVADISVDDTTPTTADDTNTDGSTSTTVDDSGADDSDESRSIVTLGLETYTVADAGTVTVNGMTVVAVDVNPGWTVEIDEASSDRIRIEFEHGETDVEFELRSDGELRISSYD